MAKITDQDLSQILQQSLDLVLVINPADRSLVFVNEQGAAWLGYDAAELINQGPFALLPELTDAELEDILFNLQESDIGSDFKLMTPVRRNLGVEHDFEFRLQTVRLNGQSLVVAHGRDIAERVAVTDQVHNLLADAQIESKQDKTTHLYEREAFMQAFADFLGQVGPDGLRLTLLVIDLKSLNEINEQYGLSVGDRVLRGMGGLLHRCCGKDDIAARYSGQKLCILMPSQGQQDGLNLADRISRTLAKVEYKEFPTLRVHSSIGVAELPSQGQAELLLDKVISRMRELKQDGQAHEIHRLGLVSLQLA